MKNNSAKMPAFDSINDLSEFFDTHDMGEYLEEMPEVHFEVNIKKRSHLVALDDDVFYKLIEIAKSKNISSETLVNSWLKEKILEAS